MSEKRPEAERQRNPLARAIQLLTVMVEDGDQSYGVRQLGGRLGVSASTAHRLLTELERVGMVARTTDGSYELGLEFHRLAWTATARFPLREAAHDILRELTACSNESSFLGIYDEVRHRMMFALSVDSAHPLRYILELNTWLPIHAGASGLAILAFLPEQARREVLQGKLTPLTDRTIVDPEHLQQRLAAVRRDGYVLSRGERIVGAVAVAAPVFGPSGAVVGDVGLTIPETRFDPAAEAELGKLCLRSAALLTERTGGVRPSI